MAMSKCPGCGEQTLRMSSMTCRCGYGDVSRNEDVPLPVDMDGGNASVSETPPLRNKPVSSNATVSNSVELRVLDDGRAQVDLAEPLPGEVCVLCREKKPERLTSTERVKAWRARRKNE